MEDREAYLAELQERLEHEKKIEAREDEIDALYDEYKFVKQAQEDWQAASYYINEAIEAVGEIIIRVAISKLYKDHSYNIESEKFERVNNILKRARNFAEGRLEELEDKRCDIDFEICNRVKNGRVLEIDDDSFEGIEEW